MVPGMRTPQIIILCMAGLLLAACSPNVETRGHLEQTEWKTQIIPEQTTRDDVVNLLGSPSARASFGDETWYYITTRRESFAFFKPEVTAQDTVRISFNADGTVKTIDSFDASQAQDVEYATRVTPTEGHQMTFMEQFLGNLGRFNSPGTAPGSSRAPGGGARPY